MGADGGKGGGLLGFARGHENLYVKKKKKSKEIFLICFHVNSFNR